jgi:hypothetical protein
MCIIAIKSAGAKINWRRLENCFDNNPDGAGFAYHAKSGAVAISKGYMDFKTFKRAVKDIGLTRKHEILFHFRIATHGAVNESNCHPFPLSADKDSLTALDITSTVVIAHNGIIGDLPASKTMSDTMIFIRDYLAPLGAAVTDAATHKLIGKAAAGSKFAIMTTAGISTIGTFTESSGWMYSNDSYSNDYGIPAITWAAKTPAYGNGYGNGRAGWAWDDDDDDPNWNVNFCDICDAAIDGATPVAGHGSDAEGMFVCGACEGWVAGVAHDESMTTA